MKRTKKERSEDCLRFLNDLFEQTKEWKHLSLNKLGENYGLRQGVSIILQRHEIIKRRGHKFNSEYKWSAGVRPNFLMAERLDCEIRSYYSSAREKSRKKSAEKSEKLTPVNEGENSVEQTAFSNLKASYDRLRKKYYSDIKVKDNYIFELTEELENIKDQQSKRESEPTTDPCNCKNLTVKAFWGLVKIEINNDKSK